MSFIKRFRLGRAAAEPQPKLIMDPSIAEKLKSVESDFEDIVRDVFAVSKHKPAARVPSKRDSEGL